MIYTGTKIKVNNLNLGSFYIYFGGRIMEKLFFTITGIKYCFGNGFMEPGMEVKLVKEPDNEDDKEAIKVELEGLGLIGYVANSPHTVLGESMSAGRLYDKIGEETVGIVKYKLPGGVLCEIKMQDSNVEE